MGGGSSEPKNNPKPESFWKRTEVIVAIIGVIATLITTIGIIIVAIIQNRSSQEIVIIPTDTPIPIPKETPVPTITPTPPVIALLTTHGNYITAFDGESEWNWGLRAEAKTLNDWEKFRLICLDDGKAAFITHHGRYVTAMGDDLDWELRAETLELKEFETFTLFDADTETHLTCPEVVESLYADGQARIALQTYHGRFVTAMDGTEDWNWIIRAETKNLLASERFVAVLLP